MGTAIGKTNRTMSAVNATEAAVSGAAWAAAQMGPIPFAPETNLWLSNSWRWLFETYPDWMILTVGTYIVHEVVFFGRWLPYVVFDRVAACRKYKGAGLKHIIQRVLAQARGFSLLLVISVLINYEKIVAPYLI